MSHSLILVQLKLHIIVVTENNISIDVNGLFSQKRKTGHYKCVLYLLKVYLVNIYGYAILTNDNRHGLKAAKLILRSHEDGVGCLYQDSRRKQIKLHCTSFVCGC